MRPRPGGGLVSRRMDDHPSGSFAPPSLDLDPIDDFSPQPQRIAEPRTSPAPAPRSRSARRRARSMAVVARAAGRRRVAAARVAIRSRPAAPNRAVQPFRPDAGRDGSGRNGRHAGRPERARHGYAARDGDGQAADQRATDRGRVQGGPDRKKRRFPGPDRSAPVSGRARPGRGPAGEGPSDAAQLGGRSRALSHIVGAEFDRAADRRYAGRAGPAESGHDRGRSGAGRCAKAQSYIRSDRLADQRTGRAAPRRSRQLRSDKRSQRYRRDHANPPDIGHLHAARRRTPGGDAPDAFRRGACGHRVRPDGNHPAGRRNP